MSKDFFSGQEPHEPRRPLSAGFTNVTMERVKAKGARNTSWLTHFPTRIPTMHKLTIKTAALVIGFGALVAGGTTYAAISWLKPDVKLDTAQGVTTLANGDKRFWIDFKSCPGQHGGLAGRNYYEMTATSRITMQQLTDGLTVACESDMLQQLFPEITKAIPKNQNQQAAFKPYSNQYAFPYAQLQRVDGKNIVLTTMFNGKTYKNVRVPVDSNAKFYEKGQPVALKDLRSGTFLTLVVRTNTLSKPWATEALPQNEIAKMTTNGLPNGAHIAGAIQHVYNPLDANKIYETMGEDWTRLERDKNAPDGWRQIAPLHRLNN